MGVGYVKRNAIAAARSQAGQKWRRTWRPGREKVADRRIHGTTGEAPIDRFWRDEAQALKPLAGMPPSARCVI